MPPVPFSEMMGSEKGEASAIIAARVGAAREVQMARQNCLNAHLDGEALYKLAAPDTAGKPARPHCRYEKIERAGV